MARVCALAALFAAAAAQDGPPPGCGGNAPLQGQSSCDECDGLVFIAAASICTRCSSAGDPLTEAMVGMIPAEDGAQICGELSPPPAGGLRAVPAERFTMHGHNFSAPAAQSD